MSEELKPCPFCGSAAYYTESVNGNSMVYVGCSPCGVHFKALRTPNGLTKDIVTAWNTRNDRTVIDAFLARVREREQHFEVAIDVVYAEMFPEAKL